MAVVLLEKRLSALAVLTLLKKVLKDIALLSPKLVILAELSQEAYIDENKNTATNPK